MKKTIAIPLLFLFIAAINGAKAQDIPFAKAEISVTAEMKKSFVPGGRLILHLTKKREKEPRFKSEITIGITPGKWDLSVPFQLDARNKSIMVYNSEKDKSPASQICYYQAVYKQNQDDGQENVPGNMISNVDSILLESQFRTGS